MNQGLQLQIACVVQIVSANIITIWYIGNNLASPCLRVPQTHSISTWRLNKYLIKLSHLFFLSGAVDSNILIEIDEALSFAAIIEAIWFTNLIKLIFSHNLSRKFSKNREKNCHLLNVAYPLFTLLLISRPYYLKTHYVS